VTPTIAKSFALLSASAIAVCIISYCYSLSGISVDGLLRWGFIVMIPVWMIMVVPMYVLEYPRSREISFSLKGFARGMPSWVAPCSWLLSFIAAVHVLWLALLNGLGVPEIINGQYVLDSRGRTLKVLTREEYLKLTDAELRAFATMMISFYFVTMAYWWLRKTSRH